MPQEPPTLDDLLDLPRRAVDAVAADLQRTASLPVEMSVTPWMETSVCIEVDHGFTTPSMWATTEPESIAEVAEYVQEQLDQTLGCWPLCTTHNKGLHAEVRDGKAVWRCRFADHTVAVIGALEST